MPTDSPSSITPKSSIAAKPSARRITGACSTRWQAVGVVELTALIGYYTMVAMTLNCHDIPLPDGVPPPLPPAPE